MEFDAGTGQLLIGLDEIAGIGPKSGVILGNDNVAGLAGETTHPLDLLPPRRRIFTAMGIGPRDDHGVIAKPPDLLDPFRVKIVILCHN